MRRIAHVNTLFTIGFASILFAFTDAHGQGTCEQLLVERTRYVFVTTRGLVSPPVEGRVVRLDRCEIANKINDPLAPDPTGMVIRDQLDARGPEGIVLDLDGTMVFSVRLDEPASSEDKVIRLSADGTQIGTITLGKDNDGPTFDRFRRLFVNDNTPDVVRTLMAPAGTPALGTTVGPEVFTEQITTDGHETKPPQPNTFLEDAKIAPGTLAFPLGDALFVMAAAGPTGDPTKVQAWNAVQLNTFIVEVIDDFAKAFRAGPGITIPEQDLPDGSFESVGMAFDSDGDLWVTRFVGPLPNQGMQLLEFTRNGQTNTFVGKRFVDLTFTDPDGGPPVPVAERHLGKISIVPGRPGNPTDKTGDTIFVANRGGGGEPGSVFVVDEQSAQQVLIIEGIQSQLNESGGSRFPFGVAACEWPATLIVSSDPPDGWIDPLSELDAPGTPRIKIFTLEFSDIVRNQDGTPLSAAAFSAVAHPEGVPFIPPPPTLQIQSVDASNNPTVVVTLDQPIPYGRWTTLTIDVEDFRGVEATRWIDVLHLPDDVDQSGHVTISDVSRFGIEFRKVPPNPKLVDMNRNGVVGGPADPADPDDPGTLICMFSGICGFPGEANVGWAGLTAPPEPQHP